MVILLLCEPRSGSTNLANWFKLNDNFTVLQEPLNKKGIDYKNDEPIHFWTHNTNHLVIKEIFNPITNFDDLINFSDKIILLYRENTNEQLESWLTALETNIWHKEWVDNFTVLTNKEVESRRFNNLKNYFNKKFLSSDEFFKVSYEELYFGNGIKNIIDYLKIDEISEEQFPYGKKYRVKKPNQKRLL